MTEMFGEAWPPMSVPDLAPDDDDDDDTYFKGRFPQDAKDTFSMDISTGVQRVINMPAVVFISMETCTDFASLGKESLFLILQLKR